jgi:site-specific recombinase XerD
MAAFAHEQPEAYEELCRIAGVTEEGRRPISFHDFRHTFITDLLVKGVNPVVVGWLVGHKELHTQRRYTHLGYSHFRDEFEGFVR